MLRPLAPLFLFAPLAAVASAQSPSFACSAAHTPREKPVCASPKLSALDSKLTKAYASALRTLSPESATLVRSDQREWLRFIEQICPPGAPNRNSVEACLEEHYDTRLKQLTEGMPKIGDTQFFTRAHFVFVRRTHPNPNNWHAPYDPGYGYGEFAWPAIDRPTPAQRAFNAAVTQFNIEEVQGTDEGDSRHPRRYTSLDEAVDASGQVNGDFFIHGANRHAIAIELAYSSYSYGAAHPSGSFASFTWRLEDGHPLLYDDVFRSDADVIRKLTPLVIARLKSDKDTGDGIEDNIAKQVANELGNPASWEPSSQGLGIRFGLYEVAAYAAGTPTAVLTWNELRPYLNPSFQPELLPAPRPRP